VGDEAFFQILSRYYEANKYGIASPESLLSIAQQVSEADIEGLYGEWLLTPGVGQR
jgi:aminopeptidase N